MPTAYLQENLCSDQDPKIEAIWKLTVHIKLCAAVLTAF